MNKNILILFLLIAGFFFITPSQADAAPIDMVVLLDTSGSVLPIYNDLVNYITKNIISDYLKYGDTFHLLSFDADPDFVISKKITNKNDIEYILNNLYLLTPLGKHTDLISALKYLRNYVSDISNDSSKEIVILTDGLHNPSDGSPYQSIIDPATGVNILEKEMEELSKSNWKINIIRLPGKSWGTQGGASTAAGTSGTGTSSTGTYGATGTSFGTSGSGTSGSSTGTGTSTGTGSSNTISDSTSTTDTSDSSSASGTGSSVTGTSTGTGTGSSGFGQSDTSSSGTGTSSSSYTSGTGGSNTISDSTGTTDTSGSSNTASNVTGSTSSENSLFNYIDNSKIQSSDFNNLTQEKDTKGSTEDKGGPVITSSSKSAKADNKESERNIPFIFLILIIIFIIIILFLIIFKFYSGSSVKESYKVVRNDVDQEGNKADTGNRRSIIMKVAGQNDQIVGTNRNIHLFKSGAVKSVGGGNCAYLIFLYKIPGTIASLKFDGDKYIFTPIRQEFFPDVANEIDNPLGQDIKVVTEKQHKLTIKFWEYISPLEKINSIMHLTEHRSSSH